MCPGAVPFDAPFFGWRPDPDFRSSPCATWLFCLPGRWAIQHQQHGPAQRHGHGKGRSALCDAAHWSNVRLACCVPGRLGGWDAGCLGAGCLGSGCLGATRTCVFGSFTPILFVSPLFSLSLFLPRETARRRPAWPWPPPPTLKLQSSLGSGSFCRARICDAVKAPHAGSVYS